VLKTWPAAAITDDMVDSLRTFGNLAFEADIARTKMNWLDIGSGVNYCLQFGRPSLRGHMNTTLLCSSRKHLFPPPGSSLEISMENVFFFLE